jgi:hypothetical protein
MQLGYLAAGVDAEFPGEPAREPSVGAEGFGLAAGAVQGEHQLSREPFPQRVLPGQGLELADGLPVQSQVQFQVQAVFQGGHPLLVQARRAGLHESGFDTGQRGPAPQAQGRPESGHGLRGLPGGGVPPGGIGPPPEFAGVQAAIFQPQAVPGRRRLDRRGGGAGCGEPAPAG